MISIVLDTDLVLIALKLWKYDPQVPNGLLLPESGGQRWYQEVPVTGTDTPSYYRERVDILIDSYSSK